jgi:cardiolipin synthase
MADISWFTLHGLIVVLAVLAYVVQSRTDHVRRQPAAAIAWMLFIVFVPYLALPAFWMFGTRKRPRPKAIQTPPARPPQEAQTPWAVGTLLALGQPAPQPYTHLAIHPDGGVAREALLSVIGRAQHSIDVSTFILRRDPLGEEVLDALCAKAGAGVRVRLLIDGLGSLMARPPDLRRLRQAGGAVTLFVSPLTSPLPGRTNLRNHRKLVLADAGTADAQLWCGGRNLGAEYFDGAPGRPPWTDLSFELRGPVLAQTAELFERDWALAVGARGPAQPVAPPALPATLPTEASAQLVASGPDQSADTLHALLVSAAYRAQRRLVLSTPYFVPDPSLLMALCLAAQRGVQVDLLLPARSNHRLSDWARGRSLRALARAGGRIWLTPGMCHAKLVVVDDTLALAGSANLDGRSLFLNYELMLAFHTTDAAHRFTAWFDEARRDAPRFAAREPSWLRDVGEGLILWLGFQL